jgi:hypothetical protein
MVFSRAKLDSIEMIIKVLAAYNIVVAVDEIKAYAHRETEKVNTTRITFQQLASCPSTSCQEKTGGRCVP